MLQVIATSKFEGASKIALVIIWMGTFMSFGVLCYKAFDFLGLLE